jgi:arsenate reductase
MAEGLINRDLADRWLAASAGTHPAMEVHPLAIRAMGEIGIDITKQVPKHLSSLASEPFDTVITVCDNAHKTCPLWLGAATHLEYIGLPDPALATGTEEERLQAFRAVRDEIRVRVLRYLNGLE